MIKRVFLWIVKQFNDLASRIAEEELKKAIGQYIARKERLKHYEPTITVYHLGRNHVSWEERKTPLSNEEVDILMKAYNQ
jgi:hypothetical protein